MANPKKENENKNGFGIFYKIKKEKEKEKVCCLINDSFVYWLRPNLEIRQTRVYLGNDRTMIN